MTKSLLLNLPAEVRIMVWKATWTISTRLPSNRDPRAKSASAQIRAICLLGKLCRQIRSEAHAEFFHRTQLLLGFKALVIWQNEPTMDLILKSNFLQQNIRHVSLYWWRPRYLYLEETLEWLANAPHLSTLEIVFPNLGLQSGRFEDVGKSKRCEPVMEEYFDAKRYKLALQGSRLLGPKTRLRGPNPLSLDKITFKFDFERAEDFEVWEKIKWFQDIKRGMVGAHHLEEGERLDPEPCHAIDYYIGPQKLHRNVSSHV